MQRLETIAIPSLKDLLQEELLAALYRKTHPLMISISLGFSELSHFLRKERVMICLLASLSLKKQRRRPRGLPDPQKIRKGSGSS